MEVFEQVSVVAAPPTAVWARIGTVEGIRGEGGLVLRRTVPQAVRRSGGLHAACIGRPLGPSWLLLFGIFPVDRERTQLTERHPGELVASVSSGWAVREHRRIRTIEAVGEGTEIRDVVTFEVRPALRRIPGLPVLLSHVVRYLLASSHLRLARHFRADALLGERSTTETRGAGPPVSALLTRVV